MEVDRANTETACPYCGNHRNKPATRQHRCKACGETVYVKRTPDSVKKRPMTYEQAEETENEWKFRHVEKERGRYQKALRSQVVHQLMLYLSYPECHHFRIYIDEPCINCSPLNQKLFRLNKHNIKNIPLPNSDCLDSAEIGYHCQSGIEAIFDNDLTPDDLANAIIEYRDDRVIDAIPANRLSQPEPIELKGAAPLSPDCYIDAEIVSIGGRKPDTNPPLTPSEQADIDAIKTRSDRARGKRVIERVKSGEKHHRHDDPPELKAVKNQTKWALVFVLIMSAFLIAIKSTESPDQTADPKQDTTLVDEIDTHLKTNFAQPNTTASWYKFILLTRISHQPAGNIIEVITMFDKTDKQAASNICGAISSYWQNHQGQINGLRIIGTGQKIISYRYSLGGPCN